jgi:type I restriction enzyme M protein
MDSAELLGAVLDQVDGICFTDPAQRVALCHLYEALLKEMHGESGSAGEFYTPRPIVRFMVAALNPRPGEVVEDVAAGSGGFLVEAYTHLARQCQTPEDYLALQTRGIRGGDAKALPLLISSLNLMLHGLAAPRLAYGNALRGASAPEMADVLLTNPPFGGQEDISSRGTLGEVRTGETALLLLQLLTRKLRRPGGRAAVVVLNGTLFAGGAAARVRERLLATCNLHTIVRLPPGAFAPYSDVPANILFFDAAGPTRDVWFYELPPQGCQRYTKTNPIGDAAFADCLAWWQARAQHTRAWCVSFAEIAADGVGLDRKNPYRAISAAPRSPLQIADDVLQKEHRIIGLISDISALLRDTA